MKRIFFLVVFSSLICGNGFAQNPLVKQWDKRFGGADDDGLYSWLPPPSLKYLQQTLDGGFIMGGASLSSISGDKTQLSVGSYDYWIIKLDSSGNKQWDKSFGGSNWDYLLAIEQTADRGFIMGGWSISNSGGDKTQNSKGDFDFWIVKVDSLGNKQWDKDFGGTHWDALYCLTQTSDSGYIIGGYSHSGISGDKTQANWDVSNTTNDYWIVKVDQLGNKQWDKRYGGDGRDQMHDIKQTGDGGYILAGNSYSNINGDKTQSCRGGYDYWIVKVDSLGSKQWDKKIWRSQ